MDILLVGLLYTFLENNQSGGTGDKRGSKEIHYKTKPMGSTSSRFSKGTKARKDRTADKLRKARNMNNTTPATARPPATGTPPVAPGPAPDLGQIYFENNSPYPMVRNFKEAVECAYYNMTIKGRNVRILFLCEYHNIPSAEDIGKDVFENGRNYRNMYKRPNTTSVTNQYINELNRALTNDHECLDVYAEERFTGNTMLRNDAVNVSFPPQIGTGKPTKGHARSMLYAYASYAPPAATRGETRNLLIRPGRRDHLYDMRHLGTSKRRPGETRASYKARIRDAHRCIPVYNCGKASVSFSTLTIDEFIAMYYGIGPRSNNNETPSAEVENKWRNIQTNLESFFFLKQGHPDGPEHPQFYAGPLPPTAGLEYMKKLRLRNRKNLKEFMTQHGLPIDFILFVMRVVLVGSQRFTNQQRTEKKFKKINTQDMGNTPANGFAVEAFADLAGFFRMFRVFDTNKHQGNNSISATLAPTDPCKNQGNQKNIVWISHLKHAIRTMQMIAMVFNKLPDYQGGEYKDTILKKVKELQKVTNDARQGKPTTVPNGIFYRTKPDGSTIFNDYDDFHTLDGNGSPPGMDLSFHGSPFFNKDAVLIEADSDDSDDSDMDL